MPALGVTGCGIATAIAMWAQVLVAWLLLRHDRFYAPFALRGRGLHRPNWPALRAQLRLGVPMGASIMVEVTGFTFMAFFISRLGATAVAGHQLAANLVSLLFMVPLSVANATTTLVAQSIGAGDLHDARRTGWNGMKFAALLSLALGSAVFFAREGIVRVYTDNRVDRRRGAAAAGLGGAVPLRRRDADHRLVRAACLAHRHGAADHLRQLRCGAWASAAAMCWPSTSAAPSPSRCTARAATGSRPPPAWARPRWA